jgi:PAS domain S-box-containing protein
MKDITNIKKLESIERELIRSETLLAKGQEIAHLGSWELDHLTGRIYLSKEVYNIFGLDPKDKIVSFRAFLEIIAPNVNTHSNIQEMLRKNAVTSIDYEQKVVRKDGKAIVIHLKGEILRDETGRPIESFGMIHDITELKQVQQALIESNERYRLQFEEATDAIILADIETGMLLDCNKAALQLTGYAYNELIGKNQKELHPTLVDFKYHLKNPEEPVAQKLLTKSAQIKDVVIKASVMQLQGRNIMQGIFRDVTEEKRTEEAIKQTKQNYETFFDNIEDFLYVLDLQGNMLRINNTVTKRLGYTEDELIGKSVLMVHPPELRNEALLIVQDMISGKRTFCPIPVMAKDGSFIPVETRVTKGEWDGRPVLFGVSRDLSQLKLSEARFAQAFHANAILMALSDEKTGEFIEVNNAFLEALGYSREEVIGKSSKDLNVFAEPKERDCALAILRETGRVRNFDVQIKTKNGKILNGLFSVDYITVGEAANTYILTTMVDITDRTKKIKKVVKLYNSSDLTWQSCFRLDDTDGVHA